MKANQKNIILILVLSICCFFPFLGAVHLFDWDEINFAESAREMIVTGDYLKVQINYQPFWEKPPLFFWLQSLSMNVFGINEFAARLPNALFGILTLLTFYFIGKKVKNEKFGLIWALVYLGSILPHFYFKSGIIDPVFNYFIFLSVYFLVVGISNYQERIKKLKPFILAGFFAGLAILTKGPVAVLLLGITFFVYWIFQKFRPFVAIKGFFAFVFTLLLVTFSWFGLEIYQHGFVFIENFIEYQIRLLSTEDSGHGQPFYYHFVILLIGCFPISIFAINTFIKKENLKSKISNLESTKESTLKILFWVVLILFSIVQTKIVHYSSLCYFPLGFLAAQFIYQKLEKPSFKRDWLSFLFLFIGCLFALALILLPFVGMNTENLIPLIGDKFTQGNLQADVNWYYSDFILGIFYLIAIVLSFIFWRKNQFKKCIFTAFTATALMLLIASISFVPRIEKYSQNALIEFYEGLQGKDVYVGVVAFKSYAHLFYSRKPFIPNDKSIETKWLLEGKIDKPAYFAVRNKNADFCRKFPDLIELESKNGFVFFKRNP